VGVTELPTLVGGQIGRVNAGELVTLLTSAIAHVVAEERLRSRRVFGDGHPVGVVVRVPATGSTVVIEVRVTGSVVTKTDVLTRRVGRSRHEARSAGVVIRKRPSNAVLGHRVHLAVGAPRKPRFTTRRGSK